MSEEMEGYLTLPLAWNPPASTEELRQTAERLGMVWLPQLEALYRQHDGASSPVDDWEEQEEEQVEAAGDVRPAAPRLMPLREVRDFYEATEAFVLPDLRLFWTDDQSNYAGVYVGPLLTGAVCLFQHDDQVAVAPRFGRVPEFLAWVVNHPAQDVFSSVHTPRPYPRQQPDQATGALEWAAAQALYARVGDEAGDSAALAVAMQLTPFEHSDALLPYLDSPDFYSSERAVEILGARRYAPARAAIERLARSGVSNARSAAQRMLKSW